LNFIGAGMKYFGSVDYNGLGDMSIHALVSLRKLIDNEIRFRDEALKFELNSDDPPTVVRFLEAAIELDEERENRLEFLSRRHKATIFHSTRRIYVKRSV
jgi:hypothetical protein